MISVLLAVGLLVAVFVGFNVGGSNTGVAFGPAVGSGAIGKVGAGALMAVFALLGGWTVGRRVVDTLGSDLVAGDPFTPAASIAVLFFIGGALFLSNLFGVPASTSMTAVGAIGGLGLATGSLNEGVVLGIVSWWLVAPVVGFWVSAVVGRYFYRDIAARLAFDRSPGPTFQFDAAGGLPRPRLGPGTTRREATGTLLVVAIGCYMAFSAGASNVANAVAPLVGSGQLSMDAGVLLAAGAIALGALTIARRTLETMGNELTELPLAAALVVAVVSATLVTFLSALGIPASFVVIATMCIVGLGWGRATYADDRNEDVLGGTGASVDPVTGDAVDPVPGAARGPVAGAARDPVTGGPSESASGTAAESAPGAADDSAGATGQPADAVGDLYRPATTAHVILLQNLVPGLATVAAYALFSVVSL